VTGNIESTSSSTTQGEEYLLAIGLTGLDIGLNDVAWTEKVRGLVIRSVCVGTATSITEVISRIPVRSDFVRRKVYESDGDNVDRVIFTKRCQGMLCVPLALKKTLQHELVIV
jgi:hypothetical protein